MNKTNRIILIVVAVFAVVVAATIVVWDYFVEKHNKQVSDEILYGNGGTPISQISDTFSDYLSNEIKDLEKERENTGKYFYSGISEEEVLSAISKGISDNPTSNYKELDWGKYDGFSSGDVWAISEDFTCLSTILGETSDLEKSEMVSNCYSDLIQVVKSPEFENVPFMYVFIYYNEECVGSTYILHINKKPIVFENGILWHSEFSCFNDSIDNESGKQLLLVYLMVENDNN